MTLQPSKVKLTAAVIRHTSRKSLDLDVDNVTMAWTIWRIAVRRSGIASATTKMLVIVWSFLESATATMTRLFPDKPSAAMTTYSSNRSQFWKVNTDVIFALVFIMRLMNLVNIGIVILFSNSFPI